MVYSGPDQFWPLFPGPWIKENSITMTRAWDTSPQELTAATNQAKCDLVMVRNLTQDHSSNPVLSQLKGVGGHPEKHQVGETGVLY